MKKEYWLKKSYVRRRVRDMLVDEVYEIVQDVLPNWCKPWVSYSPEKNSLFVSLTEEDCYDKYLRWGDFVKILIESDKEVLEVLLPKLEKLCVEIQKVLKD